jgi:hypothetical protein
LIIDIRPTSTPLITYLLSRQFAIKTMSRNSIGVTVEDDDDDYVPELPPDMVGKRNKDEEARTREKKVMGPSLPSGYLGVVDEMGGDDVYGPLPLPNEGAESSERKRLGGAEEFRLREREREEREKEKERLEREKRLERPEWMLKPPEALGLLNCERDGFIYDDI